MWNHCWREGSNLLLVKRCIRIAESTYRKGRNVKQIVQVVVSIPSIRLRGDKEHNKFDFKLMCFLCCIVGPLESSKDACFSLRTFDCQYKLWYCWERTLWMGESCFGKNSPGYRLLMPFTIKCIMRASGHLEIFLQSMQS